MVVTVYKRADGKPATPVPDQEVGKINHLGYNPATQAKGFTLEQAGAEVESIAAQLGAEHPITNQGWGALVMDWHHKMTGDAGWTILYLMVLTVGFVMLIACSSVATNVLAFAGVKIFRKADETGDSAINAEECREA